MKNVRTNLIILAVLLLTAGLILGGCASTGEDTGDNTAAENIAVDESKPVILITAFGSSYESGQKNLEDFDTAVRETFPGTEVCWGFTADFIVNKLRNKGVETIFARGVPLMTVEEAYEHLRAEGKKDVLVQTLFMMVGSEYRQALNTPTNGLNVKYSHPMLYYPENIQNIVNALESDFGDPADTVTILCAHGNEKHLEYNAELIQIDKYLRENFDNTYLAVMEGTPEFDQILKEVEEKGLPKVKFVTLMLTYGDHMSNDAMGNEEDSWKTQLGMEGSATNGLASHSGAQEVFIDNMKRVMNQF